MTLEHPHVSIGVTAYNRADPLARTLRSLLQQTYQDFELIVCDDGSRDHTPQVVAAIDDPRLRYIRHEPNIGAYPNWNSAIQASRGDYVAVYHDHDLYAPDLIERCVNVLDSNPRIGFVHFQKYLLTAEGRLTTMISVPYPPIMAGRQLARYLAKAWDLRVGNFSMVRRSIFECAGLIDESLRLAADYDLWGRLALASDLVAYIAEPLVGQLGRDDNNPLADRWRYAWISAEEVVRNRRELAARCYPTGSPVDRLQRAWVRIENDRFLLTSIAQALAHPDQVSVEEGLAVVRRQGSAFARFAARRVQRATYPRFWRFWARLYGKVYRLIKPRRHFFVVKGETEPDVPWLRPTEVNR